MSDNDHNHQHHHGHQHDPRPDLHDEPLDPGSQALADALKVSFRVLKFIMIAVVVVFLLSGFYEVKQNQRALVLRFGNIPDETQPLKAEGLHWKWPAPIDEVVMLPAPTQQKQFTSTGTWYREDAAERVDVKKAFRRGPLKYLEDHYTLTASDSQTKMNLEDQERFTDYGIVHTQWLVTYSIEDPLRFFTTFWQGNIDLYGEVYVREENAWSRVRAFLEILISQAVAMESAQRGIGWIVFDKPQEFSLLVEDRLRKRLKVLDIGLKVSLNLVDKTPPLQVRELFELASTAQSTKQTLIKKAQGDEREITSRASSQMQEIISEAEAYRTKVTQSAIADAEYLQKVLAGIEDSVIRQVPDGTLNLTAKRNALRSDLIRVTADQLYQETIREVMTNAYETFVLNTQRNANVQIRTKISRDNQLKNNDVEQTSENPQ